MQYRLPRFLLLGVSTTKNNPNLAPDHTGRLNILSTEKIIGRIVNMIIMMNYKSKKMYKVICKSEQ